MKRTPWVTAALLLIVMMILGLGCTKDKSTNPGGGGGGSVNAVQIWMPTDTLAFLPGDSAIAEGWVVAKDAQGNTVPGERINISLTQQFGFIEYLDAALRDTTGPDGRVYIRFRSFNQTGNNTIRAECNGHADTWDLVIRESNDFVGLLDIQLNPADRLQISTGGEDSARVTVLVSDSSGNGVANLSPRLSATGGRIGLASPTDNTGRTVTYWYFTGNYVNEQTFTITVRIGTRERSANIIVTPVTGNGTLNVHPTTRIVRADRGITNTTLTATLKNQLGVAVPNDTIYFAAPYLGVVNAYGITDSAGIAHATFQGGSVPSADPLDSAIVIARFLRWGLVDTVRIFIAPAALVQTVSLRANNLVGTAGVDSASLQVDVYYEDGARVEGLMCHFYKICGELSADSAILVNGSPNPDVTWKFCNVTTNAANRALVWAQVLDVTSDTLSFTVNPGPARRLNINAGSNIIPINEQLQCWAAVADSLNNLVGAGEPVMFTTTLGTLSPSSPVATMADGFAYVTLNPGTQAGQAIVKATIASGTVLDSMIVQIQSGVASTIQLDVSNSSPQVRGTGGQDWTQIIARVYDTNGNPAPDGQWVTFEIMASPPGSGCNINAHGTIDSAQTAAGVATATFNAGTMPGPVEIEARAVSGENHMSARVSNITIVSGPPASMDIEPTDIGTDADGAAWDIVVTALVRDLYNNPVRNGVAVFFDVTPDTAAIQSDTVFTGNGPNRPGIAYTVLRYLSSATNENVFITGRTAGDNGVSETVTYRLPLQQPSINLYIDPGQWHFGQTPPGGGDPCHILCRAILEDGHEVRINGSMVRYTTQRGRLYNNYNGTGNPVNAILTGPPVNEPGVAQLYLVELATFIFPDPFTGEITGDVQVEVEGYPEAIDSQIINFRRGQGLTMNDGPVEGE